MDEQKLRDEIRKLISRNKTEDAFELLSSIQFSKEDKQLIVLNSQYNRIKEELRLNIISKDEGERRINQINMALLDISNKMDSSKPTFSDYKSIPPQKQSFNPKFLLLFLIPLTAFLVYWGMSSNDSQAKKSDESTQSVVNEIEAGDDANRDTKETVTPQEKDDNNSNGDTQAKPIDNAKESTVNPDTQKPDPAEIKLEKVGLKLIYIKFRKKPML
ncbi:MAG: hypothetical protein IPJ74_00075 [Saprospiraceae bacterium]|nr:hypothetical protein [Saprospiraceae bacterium]